MNYNSESFKKTIQNNVQIDCKQVFHDFISRILSEPCSNRYSNVSFANKYFGFLQSNSTICDVQVAFKEAAIKSIIHNISPCNQPLVIGEGKPPNGIILAIPQHVINNILTNCDDLMKNHDGELNRLEYAKKLQTDCINALGISNQPYFFGIQWGHKKVPIQIKFYGSYSATSTSSKTIAFKIKQVKKIENPKF